MINPFDLKTVLLAKHAQHVVLIHFPIAMFISGVAFDLMEHLTKRSGLADTAYYNLLAAAISTFPVLATGIFAWQFQLEGAETKGLLIAAPGLLMRRERDDLAGLVAAFPRATGCRTLAELPPGG